MNLTPELRAIAASLADAIPLEGEPINIGRALRKSANDTPQGRFIRQPQDDKRMSRGDLVDGNAWLDSESGKVRLLCIDRDPNAGKWLALDDVRRGTL